jgi:hypothetical protein
VHFTAGWLLSACFSISRCKRRMQQALETSPQPRASAAPEVIRLTEPLSLGDNVQLVGQMSGSGFESQPLAGST